jgi:methionyl-tRNA formyltransferase
MRFAFAGLDRSCGVFNAFVAAGWEPVAIFTMPTDDRHDFNREMTGIAGQRDLPLQLSRICAHDLAVLRDRSCDVLVVAGYSWKIPAWEPHLRYAVNFHPSPLPEGRGPYPPLQALLEGRRAWGMSCHRIAARFDTGDVLSVEPFSLAADECLETMQLKLEMASRRLAARVASNFLPLWDEAEPQSGGSYWPRVGDAARTLDFTLPVADIMRVVRAFGLLECLALLNGTTAYVRRSHAWEEAHAYPAGQIVQMSQQRVVIAARDGFVALIEWTMVAPSLRRVSGC